MSARESTHDRVLRGLSILEASHARDPEALCALMTQDRQEDLEAVLMALSALMGQLGDEEAIQAAIHRVRSVVVSYSAG